MAAVLLGLTGAASIGCRAPPRLPASAPCAKGKLSISAAQGLMGSGDSVCAIDLTRRYLDVKVVADCPTAAPLVLNIRTADPYDSEFQPVHEERADTLIANQVKELQTNTPLVLTPRVTRLRVEIRVKCVEGDAVVPRHGDAECDVPPASGTP